MKLSIYFVAYQTFTHGSIHLVLAWISPRMIGKRWCSLSIISLLLAFCKSFFLLPIYVCMYVCPVWTHGFFFIHWGFFWWRLSQFWPVRATLSCLLCPFDVCTLSFEYSLSYVVRYPHPSLGISHFSKELWSGFFLWIFINELN